MIASSKALKIAALGIAVALHVGVANGFAPEARVELESAAGATQAAVGSSFADMSEGVMTAKAVETEAEPVEPTEGLPDTPTPERTPPTQPAETVARPFLRSAEAPEAQPSQTTKIKTAEAPRPRAPIVRAQATLSPTPALDSVPDPSALTLAATRVQPSQTQAAEAATRITAVTPDQAAPMVSKRPERRNPAKELNAPAKPRRQAKGAAGRDARKGATTGQQQAKAAVQGTKAGVAQTSGNAVASNYPGKVMRRLARVKKVRGVGRGKAEVAFKIASNGGLDGASLRRSSGSSAFDRAAVRAVQRAAPFPPPPAGAQRSFKILITGS